MTSEACIKQFIDDHCSRLTPEVLEEYKKTVQQLLSFCEKPYNEITTRDIRNWLIHLEEKLKMSSIKRKLSGLRLFFQYCVEEELIAHNPVESIPIPKKEDTLPHYLTAEQLTQLRKLIEGRLKQRAVIEVLYTTGVRISELTNMKVEDIDWSERMIDIPKGKGKKKELCCLLKNVGNI